MTPKKLLCCLLLLFPIGMFAQIGGEDEVYLSGDKVEAKFNGGGMDSFSQFIREQFNYSKVTKAGKMIGSFTIDEQGSVKNIKVIQMLDVESATEFFRVMNKCPKWQPAKRGGKPVSIEIKYPMTFNTNRSQGPSKSAEEKPVADAESEEALKVAEVESAPRFPGGVTGFYKYIGENFRVPDEVSSGGKLMVSFVVEKDGGLTDIKVLKDIGHGTAAEAIRVLKASPKWIPGKQKGIPVRVTYGLPINIRPSTAK